jgi:hypothetical protein
MNVVNYKQLKIYFIMTRNFIWKSMIRYNWYVTKELVPDSV